MHTRKPDHVEANPTCAQRLSATLINALRPPKSLATHGLQAPLFKYVGNAGPPDSLAESGRRPETVILF